MPFFLSFLPDEPHPKSRSGSGSTSGSAAIDGSSAFSNSFLLFFLSFLPNEPQPTSASGSGSGMTVRVGSSTSVIFFPPFLFFLVPKPGHSSIAAGSGAVVACVGGSEVSSSPFFPFFLSFLAVEAPHPPPHVSSTTGLGSASAVPIVDISGSPTVSSNVFFFFVFLSFLPLPKVPQPSSTLALLSSVFSSSSSSLRAPKSPKSKSEVVVFFLFFLLPLNDHALPVSPVSGVSFVVLAKESAMSVVPALAPKLQSPPVFQLPLFHPPNAPNVLSFLSLEPKSRSSFGVSSRLISSKLLVPLVLSGTGSVCCTSTLSSVPREQHS